MSKYSTVPNSPSKGYIVIDTNIILENASNIFKLSENNNKIIIPETVIDEVDSKKSGFDEINFQAREFGRFLADAYILNTETYDHQDYGSVIITSMIVQETQIDIISFKEYNLKNIEKNVLNDRKIIEVARFAATHYGSPDSTVLVSNDVMCRMRAISLKVNAECLSKNKDAVDVDFIRDIYDFDESLFQYMNNGPIQDYVDDHKHENFCYRFHCVSGNEKLVYVINDRINFVTDELFNGLTVEPLNVGQKFATCGMLDNRTDICVFEALAGSGKTLLALSAGIKLVEAGQFDKIIYIRNSVESVDKTEAVGFLPGMESKFLIYNYPLLDSLQFISKRDRSSLKQSELDKLNEQEKLQILQTQYKVETIWPGALRGRSISNGYVIIDEVQNFSKKSLQTTMTRFDNDCKIICIGSNRQIDHPYLNKYINGLNKVIESTKKKNDKVVMFGTELEKCVRGKITEWAEDIFED